MEEKNYKQFALMPEVKKKKKCVCLEQQGDHGG